LFLLPLTIAVGATPVTPTASRRQRQPQNRGADPAPRKVLLGLSDLHALGISYSRQHLHRLMREGKFPQTVTLGPEVYSRKAWRAEDVARWLAELTYTAAD
jgi:predicted DNA-binding transcriptional regulator AlpA